MAKIIEVIETWERIGRGTEKDPVRKIHQLWSKDGNLIFQDLGDIHLELFEDWKEKFIKRLKETHFFLSNHAEHDAFLIELEKLAKEKF